MREVTNGPPCSNVQATFILKFSRTTQINNTDLCEGRIGTWTTVTIKPRQSNARNLFGPNSYTYMIIKKEKKKKEYSIKCA